MPHDTSTNKFPCSDSPIALRNSILHDPYETPLGACTFTMVNAQICASVKFPSPLPIQVSAYALQVHCNVTGLTVWLFSFSHDAVRGLVCFLCFRSIARIDECQIPASELSIVCGSAWAWTC